MKSNLKMGAEWKLMQKKKAMQERKIPLLAFLQLFECFDENLFTIPNLKLLRINSLIMGCPTVP